MKTYLITDKDIENLRGRFSCSDDSWWFEARMDEWLEDLPTITHSEGVLVSAKNPQKQLKTEE